MAITCNPGTQQYIGARYVPRHMGEWSADVQYSALDVVLYTDGNSYTAKCYPPKGTAPTNGKYWALSAQFNQQLASVDNKLSAVFSGETSGIVTSKSYFSANPGKNIVDFIADVNNCGMIPVLTEVYDMPGNLVVTSGTASFACAPGAEINGVFSLDFRPVTELYLYNVKGTAKFLYNYYGKDEKTLQSHRTVRLYNCGCHGINSGLYISNPIPVNGYQDRSAPDYQRYGIEINNQSGYNALMIVNRSLNSAGETVNGGADNSALGITDKVTGVAAPTILIDGGMRHILRAINSDRNDEHILDISSDGRIAIGCGTDASDESVPGIGAIKVYKSVPTISIKDAETGKILQLYLSGNNLNVSYDGTTILVGNNADGYKMPVVKKGVNQGIVFKNAQIYTTADNKLAGSWFPWLNNESIGHLIQLAMAGTTDDRPKNLGDSDLYRGFMFFDRTLGKPIWWNGSSWRDATGTGV